MAVIDLHVNGTPHRVGLDPRTSLLDALREQLGLTGTKKGCNQGACGACTVLADGERIVACLALAVQYDGRRITTIEGIGTPEEPHPLQRAFVRFDGFQCGYCTSGQICSALGMLAEHRAGAPSAATPRHAAAGPRIALSDPEIKERMSGNLCRCGAYEGIADAIRDAAGATGTAGAADASEAVL
ncbi:(2Fe-2S)-binding protein [Streptomyces sp. Ru87]|uniref:(2Fe-2S)-binding protein n=1 Tax=Streptomyces sp. Ru87 TaxID=2044307 RepID=UPI000BF5F9BA|nr:2Fe-2S iron-sulfur cluster-binding protein [Streptomyces sp. Ru87]PGH51482.1 (2Fe-2S)-binding protein [Streptomyces sp. Ru87]